MHTLGGQAEAPALLQEGAGVSQGFLHMQAMQVHRELLHVVAVPVGTRQQAQLCAVSAEWAMLPAQSCAHHSTIVALLLA